MGGSGFLLGFNIHCLAKQHVEESFTVITECFHIGRPVARKELAVPFRRKMVPRPREKLSCRPYTIRLDRRRMRRASMLQSCLQKLKKNQQQKNNKSQMENVTVKRDSERFGVVKPTCPLFAARFFPHKAGRVDDSTINNRARDVGFTREKKN